MSHTRRKGVVVGAVKAANADSLIIQMLVLRPTIRLCSLFKVRHVMGALITTLIEDMEKKVFESPRSQTRNLSIMSRLP